MNHTNACGVSGNRPLAGVAACDSFRTCIWRDAPFMTGRARYVHRDPLIGW